MQSSDDSFRNTRNNLKCPPSFGSPLPLALGVFCLFVDEDAMDTKVKTYDKNVIKH